MRHSLRIDTRLAATLSLLAAGAGALGCSGGEALEEDGPPGGGATAGDASPLVRAQVTRLELTREPGPTFINERIPISLGITADGASPFPIATEHVVVLVSFLDADNPTDESVACSSNGLDLELVGDGTEHTYEAVIWPISECAGLIGKRAGLRVEIDPEGQTALSSEPFSSTETLELAVGPLGPDGQPRVDIDFVDLASESSVAVLPQNPEALNVDLMRPEDPRPALRVHTQLLLSGRHPYESAVDPAAVPAELVQVEPTILDDLRFGLPPEALGGLDDLPGRVRLRYELSAASDGQSWLPLTVNTGTERAPAVVIDELTPGIPNDFTHELYLDADSLAAVTGGGRWAAEDRFLVRGCFTTDFEQLRASPAQGECRSVEVLLIDGDAETVEGGAVSLSLNQVRRFSHGNSRISAEAEFITENVLTVSKISARGEAELRLKGSIGRSFDVQIFRAFGSLEAGLDDEEDELEDPSRPPGNNNGNDDDEDDRDRDRIPDGLQEGNVTLFGIDVFSRRSEGEEIEEEDPFTIERSQRIFAGRFGFGPVGVAFDFHAGGQAGLNATAGLGLFDGDDLCRPHLPGEAGAPALRRCITLNTEIEPFVALTAEAFGGIDARVVKAGVVVELTIARFGLPLQSSLSLGQDTEDQFLVHAGVTQALTFQPLAGELKLVGTLRLVRTRSRSVTIVSFRTPEQRTTLFSRVLPVAEVVEL